MGKKMIKGITLFEGDERKIIDFRFLALAQHGVEKEFECAVSLTSIKGERRSPAWACGPRQKPHKAGRDDHEH